MIHRAECDRCIIESAFSSPLAPSFVKMFYSVFAASFTSCRSMSGSCVSVKMKMMMTVPGNLNATQTSFDWVRQTISFSAASAKKKIAQRSVSRYQPRSVNDSALSKTIGNRGFLKMRPPNSSVPKAT